MQTLLQIPLHRFALVRWLNAHLVHWSIRWLMWRKGIRRPILWFVAPHVASLIGRLGESLSVYYVTDDHASMPGIDRDSMRAMDEKLTREAGIVFVASDTLLDRKLALNPNTHYSPHGVDVGHFGRAHDPAAGFRTTFASSRNRLSAFLAWSSGGSISVWFAIWRSSGRTGLF